jgi:hypothetical protein
MSIWNHIYYLVRHGAWSAGRQWGKSKFGVYHNYYDGDWITFNLGPFWICVNY